MLRYPLKGIRGSLECRHRSNKNKWGKESQNSKTHADVYLDQGIPEHAKRYQVTAVMVIKHGERRTTGIWMIREVRWLKRQLRLLFF